MSSIERAMSRMNGEEPPEKDDLTPGGTEQMVATDVEPVDGPTVGSSATAMLSADLPGLSAADDRSAAKVSVVVPGLNSTADVAASSEHSSKRPHAPSGAVASAGGFIRLDLERLAAAGFLVPDQPMTRQSEEFQHIKRRLLGNMVPGMLNGERPANLVLITSSVPGEGKTFTSTNLAISIAMEVDHTVLAIDTDIMKRDLSKVFGVVDRPGLFDLLADSALYLPDLLVRTSIPNLVVLPAGRRRDGSTELLASLRMKELSQEIATRYHDRVVLFDSPPVLATTTATALAPLVGQVVLVAEAGNTKHETIREALARLDRVRITGVILNKSKQQSTPGYDYYGSYYQARK